MKYTVTATQEDGEEIPQETAKLDDALDWFTNACTLVADPDNQLARVEFAVGGVVWGVMAEGGLDEEDPGEEKPALRAIAGGRK